MRRARRSLPYSSGMYAPVRRALCAFVAVGVCFVLSGCKASPPPPAPLVWTEPRLDGCEGVYVVLPANYSLYVDEGLLFESAGQPEDLPVFCTSASANRALETIELQAEYVQHLWRVYQLEADWDADVIPLGTEHRLTRSARIFSVEQTAQLSDAFF